MSRRQMQLFEDCRPETESRGAITSPLVSRVDSVCVLCVCACIKRVISRPVIARWGDDGDNDDDNDDADEDVAQCR